MKGEGETLLTAAQTNLVTTQTSQEIPLGPYWGPLKNYLGNSEPEDEGLCGASGEISPRKPGNPYDGVHPEEMVF